MESPFPFLADVSADIAHHIHSIILSSSTVHIKHRNIQSVLPVDHLHSYFAWTRKKKETPPSEVVAELSPIYNISLFRKIEEGNLAEIPLVFSQLKPATREVADKWYSIITNYDKLLEVTFIEAKEILHQFMADRNDIRDNEHRKRVGELVIKFDSMTTSGTSNSRLYSAVVSSTSSYRGPRVSDLLLENGNGGRYSTTYDRDYQRPSIEAKRQEHYDDHSSKPVTESRENDTSGQTKRPSEMDEQDRRAAPTNEDLEEDSSSKPTSSLSYLSSAAETATKPTQNSTRPSWKEPDNSKPNDRDPLENSMKILALSETLKDTLDNANSAPSSHRSSQKVVSKDSNATKQVNNRKGGSRSPPPPTTAPLVEQDYSIGDADPKNVFNILLLGETGVGKTTFINSFANYVKYESLDEALEKGPIILMKSSISQTHNVEREDGTTEMKQRIITVEANCNKGKKNSSNENFADRGESRTQEPLIHCIPWKEEGTVKLLRIIDTPGVNDTRGADQDEVNFDKIIKLIGKLGSLSAICILLKPNESTLSMGFRNCLDNVLIKLHRSATKNILFCFTNTRSTLYRPGDTMAPLVRYLEELETSAGVMITPNKHNMFCFDNDCFRYMCILMQLPRAKGEKIHATLSAGWVHNAQECQKLLEKIQGLIVHQVEDTVNINNARRFLTAMARPLTEIAQNHIVNRRMVETQMKQVRELSEKGEHLGSLVEQKELVIYKRPLEMPRTICTDPMCSDTITGSDGQLHRVPKKICHDNCTLIGCITPLEIGHESLKSCATFDRLQQYNCGKCGCSWKIHMHMTYEIEKKLESVASLAEKAEFRACTTHKQRAQVVLKDLENKLANIENEYDLIKKTSFEFSAFLKFNSLKTGTDPYFNYLNNAIETEKNMAETRGDMTLLFDLKGLLKEYNKGVAHHLEELRGNRRPPMTTAELWNKVENLSRMKLSGTLIADVAKAAKEEQEAASREKLSSD